ncbi:MAG TPA: nuclease-related domain-containing protein, partial [Syntrophorhabdaceae bacterium]|nr:nuclease-related domain-containing protein [Syntrophorhabdaceae bacterium]HQM80116.1 nuclease-related domain-containing protein [Syntrophorhabdaceae bacterium]
MIKDTSFLLSYTRFDYSSLAEEYDRVLNDQALPIAIAAILAAVYAGLEWWRWFTKAPPQPGLVSVAAVCIVAFCFFRGVKIRSRLNDLKLGLQGEKAVGQFLDANRQTGWHVFHDVPGDGFNVDHVLVTPQGIFTIETKTRSKPTKGDAIVKYDGEKMFVNGLEPGRNPIVQACASRDWIGNLLFKMTAIQYPVRGVVVFPGWYIESPKGGKRPDVWVLNEKALLKFIENEPVVIKAEDVALVSDRLALHVTQ